MPFWLFIWAAPLEMFIVLALVTQEIGFLPAFTGISTTLALIPIQARAQQPQPAAAARAGANCKGGAGPSSRSRPPTAPLPQASPSPSASQAALVRFIGGLRHATALRTDERVRLASEMVGGALACKMLGARAQRRCVQGRRHAAWARPGAEKQPAPPALPRADTPARRPPPPPPPPPPLQAGRCRCMSASQRSAARRTGRSSAPRASAPPTPRCRCAAPARRRACSAGLPPGPGPVARHSALAIHHAPTRPALSCLRRARSSW
jgi:hypothetical protein